MSTSANAPTATSSMDEDPSMTPPNSPKSASAALYDRAQKVLPGGVSRNTVLRSPHPLYADFGVGARVTDIEGVTRIDFSNNMASLIHGHAHPVVVDAVVDQIRKGTAIRHEGDQISGVRVWSMLDGEVGLWWLPGPAEPLSLDTASVMLAASHPEDANVEILSLQTLEWGDLSGFRFVEDWFEGPAEALLVQGPDRWLYLVRVRALDDGEISPLLRDIQASFGLTE